MRDELILALDLYHRKSLLDISSPEIHQLSETLQSLPIHGSKVKEGNFRSPASVALKLANLANHDPKYTGKATNGSFMDGVVFREWMGREAELAQVASQLRKIALETTISQNVETLEPDVEAREGKLLSVMHAKRERDPRLRTLKIAHVLKLGGSIRCEVCHFDFERFYGPRGKGYIECHHTVPLHVSGPVKTKLSDLTLLCANCHRMIHSSATWLTPDELWQNIKNAGKTRP